MDSSDSNSRAMGRKGHSSPALAVKDLKMTTRFVEWGDHRGHSVVEVTIANLAPAVRKGQLYTGFLDGDYTVHVVGEGISTSVPGRIRRLMPSDDARLDIGIKSEERDTAKGYSVRVHLYDRAGHLVMKSEEWDLVTHSGVYDASKESLDKHETPRWVRHFTSFVTNSDYPPAVAKCKVWYLVSLSLDYQISNIHLKLASTGEYIRCQDGLVSSST